MPISSITTRCDRCGLKVTARLPKRGPTTFSHSRMPSSPLSGKVINEVEPKHRDITMVFQNYALYPHMTVADNMGFSMRLLGHS